MHSFFRLHHTLSFIALLSALVLIFTPAAKAQLNWEGQTGAFATPFAYVPGSESSNISHPEIAFHYLYGGPVIGSDYQLSFTLGLFKFTEFGYTSSVSSSGSSAITGLFQGGYNTFHGKANVIPENTKHTKWVPAISVGFAARFADERVARSPGSGTSLAGQSANNADFYLVATKTITQIKGLPIVLSGGYKRTNAQILGVAGNAPNYANTAFGAAAFVVKGPARSSLVFGAEAVQQPRYLEGLSSSSTGGPTIPTSLIYFVRVVPGKLPFNIDFGVGQFAGLISPAIPSIDARHQAALGLSYRF
jgi:hypothetical protein